MEGRWTIRWQPFKYGMGGYKVGGREPWPTEKPTPVVPCDDAAVERAAKAVSDGWAIDEPDAPRTAREIAEAVLRAAGETP